jgi:hypothetical protein
MSLPMDQLFRTSLLCKFNLFRLGSPHRLLF